MSRSNRTRKVSAELVLALAMTLSACGGGGGSGSSSGGSSSSSGGSSPPPPPVNLGFTVSTPAINQAASVAGDEPLYAAFIVTITDSVAGQYGFRATYTASGISSASRTLLSTTQTEISMGFKSPHQILPGVYHDTITIGLCDDPACSVFKGTTLQVPVTYTVTTGTMPTVVVASNSVQMSRLAWDVFTPPAARIVVTPTPSTRYFLSVTTTHTSNGIASATYQQDTDDAGRIDIAFKNPTELAPGVYTDTVNVAACIDQACAYPLTVTPSVITVTYTLSSTLPGPQGYTVRLSGQAAADIAWNETRDFLYVTAPALATNYPNRVLELDPVTQTAGASVALGFDPWLLALSDDDSTLYVSERKGDAIRRLTTSPLTADILISLGLDPYPPGTEEMFAADMRVAPGHPNVLAVRRDNDLSGREGLGIVIYDDAVRRPAVAQIGPFSDWGNVAWHPDGTRLYTNGALLAVDASGPVFQSNLHGTGGRLYYVNGLLYSDQREILDPPDNFTWFQTDGRALAAAIDKPANRAYLATLAYAGDIPVIEIFDLTTRARIGMVQLPRWADQVKPSRLVRYGADGLALVNTANQLYLVNGPLLSVP